MVFASETDKNWNIGYVSGTFDMFHIGHLNLIRRAKERCNHLIVGVLSDEVVIKTKHINPIISLENRMEIIKALKYVDEVDITTHDLINKVNAWNKYKFDAMFSGDDHYKHGLAMDGRAIEELGAELVYFTYTQGISTTSLRNAITSS